MNRREFLVWSAATVSAATNLPGRASEERLITLTPRAGETNIVGPDFPATKVWGFNGQVPGTPVRCVHGQTLKIAVNNALKVPTAVHWHGIRLPNKMDGVAGLTQEAIQPGETFHYEFTPPDAGTYWYHSHVNAYKQVGRGLYGPLIIEESNPPVVDRDLVWMIDDWRLNDDASIIDNFGAGHDLSHAGRIGNVPTVNGRFRDVIKVRTGERIRLRLINASNARNFSLSFGDLEPSVITIDGQAIKSYRTKEPIVVGAAGRVDLILDMTGDPESSSAVVDSFYRQSFELTRFIYETTPLRSDPLTDPIELASAELAEPDLQNAIHQSVTIEGGAMGGLRQAQLDGEWMSLRDIARQVTCGRSMKLWVTGLI